MNDSRSKPALETIRFGEFLYEQSLLTDEQLLEVLAAHWSNGGLVGSHVSAHGYMTPGEVEHPARLYHGLEVIEVVA